MGVDADLLSFLGDEGHIRNIEIDLRPMLGRVSVAPRGEESYSALAPGYWGGNMDAPEVREGTTIYLPITEEELKEIDRLNKQAEDA